MDHLTTQGQGIFLIQEQQSEPVSDFDIRTSGEIAYANAPDTDIAWFTNPDRFFQAYVFDCERQPRVHVITRTPAPLMVR